MNNQRTRAEVEEEVEEIAMDVLEVDPNLTIEAARSMVYEQLPELYEEYRAAPVEPPLQPIAKASRELTLGEEIHRVVKQQAAQLAWTQWPTKTLEELEYEVWTTPEGEVLYELYRSPEGRQPLSQVEHKITKAAGADDAWSVLQAWRGG